MKECRTCGESKPLEAFGFTGGKSRGRLSKCKACNRVVNRRAYDKWAAKNPEKRRAHAKRQRELGRARRRAELKSWRARNPERNRELRRIENAARRARVAGAGGAYTPKDLTRIFLDQGGLCYYCDRPLEQKFHADHKTPVARGGSNGPENIACACAPCNQHKNARTEEEFLALLRAA